MTGGFRSGGARKLANYMLGCEELACPWVPALNPSHIIAMNIPVQSVSAGLARPPTAAQAGRQPVVSAIRFANLISRQGASVSRSLHGGANASANAAKASVNVKALVAATPHARPGVVSPMSVEAAARLAGPPPTAVTTVRAPAIPATVTLPTAPTAVRLPFTAEFLRSLPAAPIGFTSPHANLPEPVAQEGAGASGADPIGEPDD